MSALGGLAIQLWEGPVSESSATEVLDISLFGGFLLRDHEGRVIELTGQKDRALLGFLAASPDTPFSRDKLAALLWGDSGDKQARDSLKQALLRLRRAFDRLSNKPLITNRQTVILDGAAVRVDVGAFERLLAAGDAAATEKAILLYRGDLLDGVLVRAPAFEDWLLVERQRLRQLATEAATRLMAGSLDAGRRDLAATAGRRLLSLDPLHEAACRTLMRIHADRGERAQALKVFETLRERLSQDLGVAPDGDTVALYHEVRRHRGNGSPAKDFVPGQDGGEESPTLPEPDVPSRSLPVKPSIAVLPFANIGGEPEQDYFADGLTEDIITDLSRVSALFVAARNSVFTFKGRAVEVREAARELNVGFILEGSVRKAAGRVRITAQLVDGATGGHLWAERYDRALDDIFALQDEIAESIVEVLKVKLLPEEHESIVSHATTNVDAYQYYLMGRSFYLRGIDMHSLRIAREMFAKAAEIDPDYARAYAALAVCESYLSMHLSMGNPEAEFESCLALSERALVLDPNLAEAHAGKGLALYAAERYAEAAAAFRRAMELDPESFEAHFFYARNCRHQGRRQQAAELFERAAALRSSDYRSLGLFAEECQALGREADSRAALRRCLERVEAEVEAHPDNAGALAFGSAVLADLGQSERAEDWALRAVMIGPAEDCMVRYNVARTFALLGKLDPALDALEQAFGGAPVWQRRLAMWMKDDEDIDPLRGHSRFRALLRRLEAEIE